MYLCEQSYASAQLWCRVEGELVLVWGVRPNASVGGGGGGLGLCLRVQGGGVQRVACVSEERQFLYSTEQIPPHK